jgi:hypothetical protein
MNLDSLKGKVKNAAEKQAEKKAELLTKAEKEKARREAIEEAKQEAIEELKAAEKAAAGAKDRADEKLQIVADKKEAVEILKEFSEKAEIYAEEGLTEYEVMNLSQSDFKPAVATKGFGTHKDLVGPARIVYASLKKKGFDLDVEPKGHMQLTLVASIPDGEAEEELTVDWED